ncbi:TRI15 protein [Plectosphaerella plurivora]|uniref:TRI15 protein n=1 Tax=Plectosphaerella plurivora TaxID=936078 RepID=A0A9P9A6V4_9PEZI|nr:TRI15 protein [Plectosphaerella plurivora]
MVGANTVTATGATSPFLSKPNQTQTPRQGSVFDPEQCLLCNKHSSTFEANVTHMQTAHGLYVPHRDHLIVDQETLFAYIHLVIVGYNECICCGTRRNSTLAVQQHMLGKGHCHFDVDEEDSEFADFYDFTGTEEEADEEDEDEDRSPPVSPRNKDVSTVRIDDNSLRLPSGRVISNRSQQQRDPRRQPLKSKPRSKSGLLEATPSSDDDNTQDTSTSSSSSAHPPSSSTALATRTNKSAASLAKAERQELKFTKKLASLSTKDAMAIAHLPQSEQRAIIATRQKQVEKATRLEEHYRGRLESGGNQFLMTHFVKDAADKRTLWK